MIGHSIYVVKDSSTGIVYEIADSLEEAKKSIPSHLKNIKRDRIVIKRMITSETNKERAIAKVHNFIDYEQDTLLVLTSSFYFKLSSKERKEFDRKIKNCIVYDQAYRIIREYMMKYL